MAAKDQKVFDVGKPGSAKPETGSKPMVVGHKIMKDPTLTESKEDSEEEKDKKLTVKSEKTIAPISDEKVEETAEETPIESTTEETDVEVKKPIAPLSAEEKSENGIEEEAEETPQEKQKNAEDKAKDEANLGLELDDNLQKMIKDKTYNVHIHEANFNSAKTFFKTLIVVGLVGLIAILVLIDAEIIDLGVNLPFDLL